MIFYLKNRDPENWSDRRVSEIHERKQLDEPLEKLTPEDHERILNNVLESIRQQEEYTIGRYSHDPRIPEGDEEPSIQ